MSDTDDDTSWASQQFLQDLQHIEDTAGSATDKFRRQLMATLAEYDRDRGIRGHLAQDRGGQLVITVDGVAHSDWRPQPGEQVFVVPVIEVPGPATD